MRVYGNESAGRYVEFVEVRTGKTVGHKVFPPPVIRVALVRRRLAAVTRHRMGLT